MKIEADSVLANLAESVTEHARGMRHARAALLLIAANVAPTDPRTADAVRKVADELKAGVQSANEIQRVMLAMAHPNDGTTLDEVASASADRGDVIETVTLSEVRR